MNPMPTEIMEAYLEMGMTRLMMGFDLTLLSIMFRELGGSDSSKKAIMHSAVTHLYSRHRTRVVRKTSDLMKMPFWIVCDDWPVPKKDKDHFVNIAINDGHHMHALAFTPPRRRFEGALEFHFNESHSFYCPPDLPIARIHSRTVTETPHKLMRYGLKSLQRRRIDAGDIFVLPRHADEISATRNLTVTPRQKAQERQHELHKQEEDLRIILAMQAMRFSKDNGN